LYDTPEIEDIVVSKYTTIPLRNLDLSFEYDLILITGLYSF
jgi:hypothetical protein